VKVPAPLRFYAITVPPDWIDYHGHMSEAYYLMAMSEAIDPLFDYVGCDAAYRAGGRSLYSVGWRLDFRAEGRAGDRLDVETLLLGHDSKRVHLLHTLCRGTEAIATGEQILLHVDRKRGKSASMDETLLAPLSAMRDAHAVLPRLASIGTGLSLPDPDRKS
jgi:acyl-CoA thioesterase FadM